MRRLAVLLLMAVWVTPACTGGHGSISPTRTRSPGPVGEDPVHAEGIAACPANATIAAAGTSFYPPWFPAGASPPPDPQRCFATTGQAVQAGFAQAPPPPGGLEDDGVYLVPADLDSTCRRAARRLGFPVVCPALVPGSPGAFQSFAVGGEFLLDGMFPAPPGYAGFAPGSDVPLRPATGHLVVESDPRYPSNGRYGKAGYCSNQRPARHVVVRGRRGEFVLCPPGSEQH